MKLEQQVCSLELAKRLKELGVKQESAFWYERVKLAGKNQYQKDFTLSFNNSSEPYSAAHIVSAFTVAELGEMLPTEDEKGRLPQITKGTYYKSGIQWQVMYTDTFGSVEDTFENATAEADARASMLIYLIENKLITLP